MLIIDGLNKSFGNHIAIADFHLSIGLGEFWTILGPSGCGKSTLLRCVAGLEKPDHGTMSVDGRAITLLPPSSRDVSFSFQSGVCFDHWSVEKNLKCESKRPANEHWDQVVAGLELGPLLHKYPDQLSGGELQRASLGRTLLSDANIWLLDEPIAQLNPRLRFVARELIRNLHQLRRTTVLYVTHDVQEAMSLSNRIVIMNRGRIDTIASPGELLRSRPVLPSHLKPLDASGIAGLNDKYQPSSTTVELLGVPCERLCKLAGHWIPPHRWKIVSIRESNRQPKLTANLQEDLGTPPFYSPAETKTSAVDRYATIERCQWQLTYWELDLSFIDRWHSNPTDGMELEIPQRITIHVLASPWLPSEWDEMLQVAAASIFPSHLEVLIEPC